MILKRDETPEILNKMFNRRTCCFFQEIGKDDVELVRLLDKNFRLTEPLS